ncbi:hypothetical protein RND71_001626 [Anisodus tanguticus]|uniref:Glutamate/phenylalanine/leucine/valine/L-tryptophan dehydrogenase C-terminal domain-containing protein n=1 Tax=Anisodus tanguticus TaxID=243964 RepID=A0AAE1VY79_9SOLA|nr:hypothetical protein RND71_001626 [Anisodus tanguticus]
MLAQSTMMKLSLGVKGSNIPCTAEAVDVLRKADVLVAPSMTAGVGGVGSSVLDYSLFMICNSFVEKEQALPEFASEVIFFMYILYNDLKIQHYGFLLSFALVQSKLMLPVAVILALVMPTWIRYNAKVGKNGVCPEVHWLSAKAYHIFDIDKISDDQLQVVAGELELKECSLNWSPEDFESKLLVNT